MNNRSIVSDSALEVKCKGMEVIQQQVKKKEHPDHLTRAKTQETLTILSQSIAQGTTNTLALKQRMTSNKLVDSKMLMKSK